MTATDNGEKAENRTPNSAAPKPRTPKAECRAFYGKLGGKRYKRGEVVTLTQETEREARANPTVWRVF